MRQLGIGLLIGTLALIALPATALSTPGNGQSKGHGVEYAPAPPPKGPPPNGSLPEKAKAYGRYCQDQSKKHVKGEKGTPFSQCVTAMAKASHDARMTARKACKGLSKKHVKGQRGTPFSRCLAGVAKLRDSGSH